MRRQPSIPEATIAPARRGKRDVKIQGSEGLLTTPDAFEEPACWFLKSDWIERAYRVS
jgi:hypothetical protein